KMGSHHGLFPVNATVDNIAIALFDAENIALSVQVLREFYDAIYCFLPIRRAPLFKTILTSGELVSAISLMSTCSALGHVTPGRTKIIIVPLLASASARHVNWAVGILIAYHASS